jgi:hypothetical protein
MAHRPAQALAAWLSLIAVGLLAGLPAPAADSPRVAAVFPPWWTRERIWAAAAAVGDVLDAGASPSVVVFRRNGKGLEQRLGKAGAILLLDPRSFAGCGLPPKEIRS